MAVGFIEISDLNFESRILKSEKPAMVDFWAPWCGPCRTIEPVVEELADAFGSQITFAKCNVDDNPVIPSKYNIKAIPTLIFFKEGRVNSQVTGLVDKTEIETALRDMLL